MREAYRILRRTIADWRKDEVPRLGASLAYYTVFSAAPLLLIAVAVIGLFFGERVAQALVAAKLDSVVGPQAAHSLLSAASMLKRPSANRAAAAFGMIILLVGASGVVGELKTSLDLIWEAKPPGGWRAYLRSRLVSLLIVLLGGVLILGSLVLATIAHALGLAAGFGAVTVLFALLYKLLPDTVVRWSDVWVGAAATAAMMAVGNLALGWYFRRSVMMSAYGAAASLLVVLAWVYYSAQIFYFGAEFTHAWSDRRRSSVRSRSEGKRRSSS